MEVSLFAVSGIQFSFDRGPADLKSPDAVPAVIFKRTLHLQDQATHQALHPLHHDHKIISVVIHEADVFFTEIAAVQDEPDVLIAVAFRLFQRVLQL